VAALVVCLVLFASATSANLIAGGLALGAGVVIYHLRRRPPVRV
jgi:hypothetical protein